jgi:hypothetical protein
MTPGDPNQTLVEAQHRSLLIIWLFLFMSVVGFFVMTFLVPSSAQGDNRVMAMVLIGLSLVNVVLSFVLKRTLLAQSVAKQALGLVQKAYIVALAMCEASAIFGVLIHFVTGSVYYYVAIGVGIIGMVLHFPKKQHLLDASFKKL